VLRGYHGLRPHVTSVGAVGRSCCELGVRSGSDRGQIGLQLATFRPSGPLKTGLTAYSRWR
jgi:hypothetical protein